MRHHNNRVANSLKLTHVHSHSNQGKKKKTFSPFCQFSFFFFSLSVYVSNSFPNSFWKRKIETLDVVPDTVAIASHYIGTYKKTLVLFLIPFLAYSHEFLASNTTTIA